VVFVDREQLEREYEGFLRGLIAERGPIEEFVVEDETTPEMAARGEMRIVARSRFSLL